jgi:hypothetical protein
MIQLDKNTWGWRVEGRVESGKVQLALGLFLLQIQNPVTSSIKHMGCHTENRDNERKSVRLNMRAHPRTRAPVMVRAQAYKHALIIWAKGTCTNAPIFDAPLQE